MSENIDTLDSSTRSPLGEGANAIEEATPTATRPESVPRDLGFVPPPFLPYPEGVPILAHKGSCFCGKYKFEVQHPPLEVRQPVTCNCTWCSVIAALYIYADEGSFRFLDGTSEDDIGRMSHKKGLSCHYFCEKCSSNICWRGFGKVGLNARLLEGVVLEKLQPTFFDEKNLI